MSSESVAVALDHNVNTNPPPIVDASHPGDGNVARYYMWTRFQDDKGNYGRIILPSTDLDYVRNEISDARAESSGRDYWIEVRFD